MSKSKFLTVGGGEALRNQSKTQFGTQTFHRTSQSFFFFLPPQMQNVKPKPANEAESSPQMVL